MAEIVLTPGQLAAVESRGCALLVAAAAGSGKTRVLIDRVLDQVIREGRCVDEFQRCKYRFQCGWRGQSPAAAFSAWSG